MPLGKTPAEIVKNEADICMVVLQGFVLGRYGEAVVAREITDEYRLILRQALKDLLDHAIAEMPKKKDEQHWIYNASINDCIAVLNKLKESV